MRVLGGDTIGSTGGRSSVGGGGIAIGGRSGSEGLDVSSQAAVSLSHVYNPESDSPCSGDPVEIMLSLINVGALLGGLSSYQFILKIWHKLTQSALC